MFFRRILEKRQKSAKFRIFVLKKNVTLAMEVVPETLKKWSLLEDKIFSANDENTKDTKEYILSLKEIKNSIFNLIYQAALTRIFSFKALSDIWISLGDNKNKYNISPFTTYLSYKGINKSVIPLIRDDNIAKTFENVFPDDTLGYAILHDDFEKVVYFSADRSLVSKPITSYPGRDQLQFTVLSLAAYCGSVKVFKYFFINTPIIKDDTVVKAVMGGSVEIVEILSRTFSMKNYLNIAIQYHRNELIPWIVENYQVAFVSPVSCLEYFNTFAYFFLQSKDLLNEASPQVLLKTAIQNECIDYIKYFMANGASVNPELQVNGICPPLITAILQHSPIIVKYLLIKGANIEQMWVNHTPLLLASQYRNSDVVSILIKEGADVNSKGDLGSTPLIQATSNGHLTNVKLLINAGANVNETDKYHSTALHIALTNKYEKTARLLIESNANLNAQDIYGNTPLHIAVDKGLTEEIKMLLSKGADSSIKNELGETPVQKATTQEITSLFEA